jgi:hypothetical protein
MMLYTWHQIWVRTQSRGQLRRKARAAAPLIVQFVSRNALELYKEENGDFWWGDDDRMLFRVVLGDALFYLHVIDRYAFAGLGEERRAVFMDALLPAVRDILAQSFEGEEVAEFAEDFQQAYNRAQMRYTHYKRIIPEQSGGPLEDTLLWEFAKMRASDIGIANPIRLSMIHLHAMTATKSLVEMLRQLGCF